MSEQAMKLPEVEIKQRLLEAMTYALKNSPCLGPPEEPYCPTYGEARRISEAAILVVVGFVEWVEAKMKIEAEKAMTEIKANTFSSNG